MFDPLAAISTIPAYAIRRTACVLHTRYKAEGAYETRAGNLNNCGAERGAGCRVLSRKTSPPADAFLYIIWPADVFDVSTYWTESVG